jgi:TRAP-type transport system periplasmic protein
MEKFAEIVQAKSGGKLKVNVFPGGALGSDQANVSALQGGTLEMAAMNSGIFASIVKEFAVYDFPFLFGNPKEADAVVDGAFGTMLHQKLQEKGLVGLAYYELGFRELTNSKHPITKVEDIAGLKLRVIPNPINVDWVSALGANPTPLPFPELYAALEQKAVDGQENPVATIEGAKLYEVQKYMTLTNHQYNPQSVVISKKFWDSLSPEEQKIVSDAAHESAKYQREQSRAAAAGILASLKKSGMEVAELPPGELAKMREKMKPVIAKHTASVGEGTVKALMSELDKARR